MIFPFRVVPCVSARFLCRPRCVLRRIVSIGVGCACVSWFGATIALCRPLDTPSYLIPYYLRDVDSRFRHYATHRKRKGGPLFMTVEDFVRAVLAVREASTPITPRAVSELRRLFAVLDADGDALLGDAEFALLMHLLAARPGELRVLFRFLDERGVGYLERSQFVALLRGIGCASGAAERLIATTRKSGMDRFLFGPNGDERVTHKQLEALLDAVRVAIWRAEFRQVDTEGNDRITAEQFGRLLADQMLGSHVPFYMIDNIRKMRGSGETMSIDLWVRFHRVMQHAEGITEAVELYTAAGLPLRRADFNRAVRAAGLEPFSEVQLDLIMALFDRNGDGVLLYDELLSVMEQKLTYHSRHTARVKKNLHTRLAECTREAIDGV